ncbi:hypothetical protein M9X92_012197 [Pyricularia oryzae]|nr:hypothetical protein M9X92_012197 [Pyricularia oryzae]
MAIEDDDVRDREVWTAVSRGCARDSILTLFEPIMAGTHGNLQPGTEDLEDTRNEFLSNLDLAVAKGARRWLEAGYQIAVTNLCALLDYGLPTNVLMRALDASTKDIPKRKIVVGDEPASAKSQEASETQKPTNTDDKNAPIATATEAKDDVVDLSKRFKEVLQFYRFDDGPANNVPGTPILGSQSSVEDVVGRSLGFMAMKLWPPKIFTLCQIRV